MSAGAADQGAGTADVVSAGSSTQIPAPTRSTIPSANFASLSHLVDPRILRALASLGFAHPTPVQQQAIPLAVAGRDILAKASTGSGKTLAYIVPTLHKILTAKSAIPKSSTSRQCTRALILVPTRELSEQVTSQVNALLEYCNKEVAVANIARDASASVHNLVLADRPDIVVATPSRVLGHVHSQALSLSSVETLIIDEADLILSYGHDEDVRALLSGGFMPKTFQSFLMSATMTNDVKTLKGLVLRKPAVLNLHTAKNDSTLTQYMVRLSEQDKFLLLYVILKLRLIRGKCIIFVNDIDRCYRVKLFLEQFGLRACVLNAEMPVNSRFHIVQEFNKGLYDYIIATDEARHGAETDQEDGQAEISIEESDEDADAREVKGDPESTVKDAGDVNGQDDGAEDTLRKRKRAKESKENNPETASTAKRPRREKGDQEYGVSRGVDFVNVACVINFDLPTSARSYTHRVGRTARAGSTGTALSFVVPLDLWGKHKVVCCPTAKLDEEVWKRIERQENEGDIGAEEVMAVKEWKYDKKQVEAFRYRMEDALRSVTRATIKEARIREIKNEILNSEKLRAHFEDNPHDLAYLQHDKALHPSRVQAHMRHVPSYLMPRITGLKQPRPSFVGETGNGRRGSQRKSADGRARMRQEGGEDASTSAGAEAQSSTTGIAGNERISRDEDGRSLGYVGLRKTQGGSLARGGRGNRGRGRAGSSRGGSASRGGRKKSDPLRKFGGK